MTIPMSADHRRGVGRAGHLARVEARGVSSRLAVRSCAHPDTGPSSAARIVREVRDLYEALAAAPDLTPGPAIDEIFGCLVSLAIDPVASRDAAAVLADPSVTAILPELRRLCAEGEFELERSWARHVVEHPDPCGELARFPYHQNYRDLTRLEHHTVAGLTATPPQRVLFIGSGPLPLTSLLLADRHRCRVDNLDLAPEAARLGAALAHAVGSRGMTFHAGDVLDDPADLDPGDYDLVYLAALAGLDHEAKDRLLSHLGRRLRPGTLVLARSAHSLRGLLYPVLDPADLPGLDTLAVVHPFTDVVNSVVVARVTAS